MDRERYILPRHGERAHTAADTDQALLTIDAQFKRRPYVVRLVVRGASVSSVTLRNVTGTANILTKYPADGHREIVFEHVGPNTGGVSNWPGYGQQLGYSLAGGGNASVEWEVAEVS